MFVILPSCADINMSCQVRTVYVGLPSCNVWLETKPYIVVT